MLKDIVYLDNAASSWPKPQTVIKAMMDCITNNGANPGGGSHQMAINASRTLFDARMQVAKLFGARNPNDIVFTLNTIEALNLAIKGFVQEPDHVICTAVEHNSVRRPLEYLKRTKGVEVTYIETNEKGHVALQDIEKAFQKNTKLFVCTHSSNLLGVILPIENIAKICKKRDVKLLVDAAQTAGTYPIHVMSMGIDMLAFPGHKGLLGPQGTGGLYIHPDIEIQPFMHGGTGSQSEELEQPTVRPDRYEAGTQNTPGLAGLCAGISYVRKETVEAIHKKEWELTQLMMEGLMSIKGVSILGPELGQNKTGIVSFIVSEMDASEIAYQLDRNFQIAVRAGYHCAPLAHQTAGTIGTGAVRASVGCFSTIDHVHALVEAMKQIVKR